MSDLVDKTEAPARLQLVLAVLKSRPSSHADTITEMAEKLLQYVTNGPPKG